MSGTGDTGATSLGGDVRRDDDDDREVTFYEDTEARRSVGTSEFWIYVIVTAILLFFTYQDGGDSLSRDDGWRYAAAMTIGYFLSRGLAKAGSSEPRMRQRRL
jgi:hypothetical protein